MSVPIPFRWATAAALLLVVRASFAGPPPESARIVRIDRAGAEVWSLEWKSGEPDGAALLAPEWFPVVPERALEPVAEGEGRPAAVRGSIALLDLWASWCAPCLQELPHLQEIHDRLAERGLRVVAVNVDDPTEVLRRTALDLGLAVEIARPTDALRDVARPRSLPTLLLVDAEGRVRGRWDGYRPGLERDVESRARALLDDPAPPPPAEVAREVAPAAERFSIRWARDVGGAVEGVAIERREGRGRVLVASGRDVLAFEHDGGEAGRAGIGQGTGRIVQGDFTGDGRTDVAFWRPGSPTIGALDMARRATASWDASGPVLDVAVLPPANEDGRAYLVVATPDGLAIHAVEGHRLGAVDSPARAVAVARWPGHDSASPAYLAPDGRVVRIAPDGTAGGEVAVPARDGRMVAIDGGLILIPFEDAGWARADGDAGLLVVYRDRGDLLVLDAENGGVRSRTAWPDGIVQAAVGDLDGDGRAEIVIGSGRRVVVLEPGAAAAAPAGGG